LRRRPGPMGLCFGELEDWTQMPQWTAFWPALDAERVKLGSRKIEIQPGKRHLALAIDEHTRLAQRDAYVIAATIARPPGECQKDAIGGKVARGVVAGGCGQQRRAIGALGGLSFVAQAGHGLRHLLPAAAMTKWPIGAVAVDRGVDDARSKR